MILAMRVWTTLRKHGCTEDIVERKFTMRKAFAVLALASALTGCATPQPPLLKNTASGRAEGVFEKTTLESAKSQVITKCATRGANVLDTSGNQVVCGGELKGGQAIGYQLALGNSYSTTPQVKIRFVFATEGENVRVIAFPWVETIMPLGQVRTMDLNGNGDRNDIQRMVNEMTVTADGYWRPNW